MFICYNLYDKVSMQYSTHVYERRVHNLKVSLVFIYIVPFIQSNTQPKSALHKTETINKDKNTRS